MALSDGEYRIGADSGRLLVHTGRTGIGTRAGHDLTIEATRWDGNVIVDTATPARSSVTVDVDVDSLEVGSGSGGVKPLTSGDRAEIKRIIRAKLLRSARFPTISFRSTAVSGSPDSVVVDGQLTVMGVSRPLTVQVQVSDDGRVRGSAAVVQTRWGITPYSAFFGALKVADEVTVEFEVELRPAH